MLVEQVRNRVRETRTGQGQEIRGRRLNDAPQSKLVGDDQRDWYFPGQEPGQRFGVAAQRVKQTFAVGQPLTGGVLGEPVPVGLDRLTFQVACLDFVEARFSHDRHWPTLQREGDRFPGTRQARADSHIDGHVDELRAEGTRLRSPSLRQKSRSGMVGAQHAGDVRRRLAVPGKDEQPEWGRANNTGAAHRWQPLLWAGSGLCRLG